MPTNIIDSIQLSGVTYTLSAQTSGGDVSSAITSGDTNAVAGGAVYDKFDEVEQVTAAALNVLNESLSGKQDTLSAGTNITIVDNVISASGGGGVTTGEVQTMIDESISGKVSSVRLYDYKDSGSRYQVLQETKNGTSYTNICDFGKINDKAIVGTGATYFSLVETSAFTAHTADSVVHITSAERTAWNAKSDFSGSYNDLTNKLSAGTNITIVDNVISATGGGGGGGTVDQTIISGSTNAVAGGAVYDKFDEVEEVTAAALNTLNDKFDGLKLKKLTQTQYDNLQTKDPSTLYIIVD